MVLKKNARPIELGFSLRSAADRPGQKPLRICTRRRKAFLGPWPAVGQKTREGGDPKLF
ncbi:hypothetical protein AK812_SmicGene45772, partial [Symbiodinium microadriaticum]